jgi:hypothetical protein
MSSKKGEKRVGKTGHTIRKSMVGKEFIGQFQHNRNSMVLIQNESAQRHHPRCFSACGGESKTPQENCGGPPQGENESEQRLPKRTSSPVRQRCFSPRVEEKAVKIVRRLKKRYPFFLFRSPLQE